MISLSWNLNRRIIMLRCSLIAQICLKIQHILQQSLALFNIKSFNHGLFPKLRLSHDTFRNNLVLEFCLNRLH